MTRLLRSSLALALLLPALPSQASDTYSYQPRRDPFEAPALEAPPPEEPGPCQKGATCNYTLDQLKVVAFITGQGSPVAMVEDPEGVGHLVQRGSRLGKERALVVEIYDGQLVLEVPGKSLARRDWPRVVKSLPAEKAADPVDLSRLKNQ